MGVYIRKDSPYYWLNLPRKNKPSKKEATRILVKTGDAELDASNRQEAQRQLAHRLNEFARQDRYRGNFSPEKIGKLGQWCYIYFVRQGQAIKIGRAVNVLNRMRQLHVATLAPLEVLAFVPAHQSVETLLHRHFRRARIKGEWFSPTPELLALIERIKAGEDVATVTLQLRDDTQPMPRWLKQRVENDLQT